jgi:pimeloyl-ACP methyl ester carboxylesterase
MMYNVLKDWIFVLFLFLIASCISSESKITSYKDVIHQSTVFGKDKTYRIYLPENYYQSQKEYLVVYYFHGWGGRHSIGGRSNIDYDALVDFADKYQTIIVLWDGRIVEDEPRPYNIGHHSDVKFEVQMKDYFIELIEHIDESYRTHAIREKRGVIGFSMGGFMSFYLAGKYPHMVSAAVNIVGSQEFFIGYPGNHTLYPLVYTFENLRDVDLLLYNRTHCPMAGLNDEVINAAQWHGLTNFRYYKTEGEHNIDNPGETDFTQGNADGLAAPGERVMLFKDQYPLRLYSNDPYIVSEEETLVDMILLGQWPDGFTHSSVVKISDDCPPGHVIVFLASYETKTFMPMYSEVIWGKVKLSIQ